MGTRGSFLGGKVAGAWSWPLAPSNAEVKEWVELHLHSHYAFMAWCSAKAQRHLYFYLLPLLKSSLWNKKAEEERRRENRRKSSLILIKKTKGEGKIKVRFWRKWLLTFLQTSMEMKPWPWHFRRWRLFHSQRRVPEENHEEMLGYGTEAPVLTVGTHGVQCFGFIQGLYLRFVHEERERVKHLCKM
jgi:hypothetical protein